MTRGRKRAAVEEDKKDRISGLPSNVMDRILELLPVHDAARTSILSKEWRYIWTMLPSIMLDKHFCSILAEESQSVLEKTVDKILLQHVGDIVKFVLDVSGLYLSLDIDIDKWMLYVTRNGVKKLTLNMSNSTTYKLPSNMFNCPTLTYLELYNCVFQPPNSFLGFKNLITLRLERITFLPTAEFCVIKAPLLVNLTLRHCNGTQYLNIVSSMLKCLHVQEISHYGLDINCFINCKNLRDLTKLKVLSLGSSFLELLSAGAVPKGLPFTLSCLRLLRLSVDFSKVRQISYALELIKSSPVLGRLGIWVQIATCDGAEAAMNYLDSPACLDRPLNKLTHVHMCRFKGSKTELHFVKLLFARTPCLLRMSFKHSKVSGSSKEERNNITTELMCFPRASPKAELFL